MSSSLAIFVGCICNRLIKWGKERKGKGIRGVANNGCDKQREYSVVKACKRHFKVTEFCSNQRGFFVLISLCAIYTLYILYIVPPSPCSYSHALRPGRVSSLGAANATCNTDTVRSDNQQHVSTKQRKHREKTVATRQTRHTHRHRSISAVYNSDMC